MQKYLKKFSAILIALLAAVCLAVFAVACGDDTTEEPDDGNGGGNGPVYATTTFTVTVVYEDGTPINGVKKGEDEDWMMDSMPTMVALSGVQIQFCAVGSDGTGNLSACAVPDSVGEDGKVTIEVSKLVNVATGQNSDTVELHVLNVSSYGYVNGHSGEYGRYNVNEIPLELTITLQMAEAAE